MDAWSDYLLSRQAILVSENTLLLSQYTCGRFVDWLEERFVTPPQEIQSRHVRAFLSELGGRGLSDDYIHFNARVIKTFVRFIHAERHIVEMIAFRMPNELSKDLLSDTNGQLDTLVENHSCSLTSVRALPLSIPVLWRQKPPP